MIPARDGAARGVVDPGVAGHGVGPADGHGDAPGRSPDGLAIASPLVAAVEVNGFSPLSVFSSNFCRPL